MSIGKLGVFASIEERPAAEAAEFARRLEAWGYGVLWIPEAFGREVFSSSAWLLSRTARLVIASGIANIYARDPVTAAAAQKGLNEQSGGRFLLGLGVSHVPLVTGVRKHAYLRPIGAMQRYLEEMATAPYGSVAPGSPPKTVIAALGPKMLDLAAQLADGAFPYLVTPEHTHDARTRLGPGKLLCVEQSVILQTDPARARAIARRFLTPYLGLPNYVNNWKRLGFSDADVAAGGSDRLVDALVPWGDERSLRGRIEAHWQAGADHVCIQAVGETARTDEALLARLAPGAG